VDNSNNVYVTDFNNDRVEKFDNNGNYLTQWGSEGTGNGQFETPQGVAVDSSGNFIYVVDNGNLRIQVFVNNANIVPPIITQQPTNQTVPFGANVTFSVGVVGAAPFAYQWNSNSIAISSATNATFTLTNVSLANSGGTYSVLVSNIYGSVLSSNAVLTVLPTLVTTQPASGLSATGAVLNGSVILGSDETVAWFEWGTDTNYGNISGDTIVPGNNGSNSISATLTGLPGNFYHYRLGCLE
jgi:tripartite motif-containing protein 71